MVGFTFRWSSWLLGVCLLGLSLGVNHTPCKGTEPTQAVTGTNGASAEASRFRPDVSFDAETGRVIYTITNISSEPIKVSLESVAVYDGGPAQQCFYPGGFTNLYFIVPDPDSPSFRAHPDSSEAFCQMIDEVDSMRQEWRNRLIDMAKHNRPGKPPPIVTLRPGEGLSRTVILQDEPWYDDLVAILERTQIADFLIVPQATVFCADDSGALRPEDNLRRSWFGSSVRTESGAIERRYPRPSPPFTLATARRLRALKAK